MKPFKYMHRNFFTGARSDNLRFELKSFIMKRVEKLNLYLPQIQILFPFSFI